jgi:hypothetical protein
MTKAKWAHLLMAAVPEAQRHMEEVWKAAPEVRQERREFAVQWLIENIGSAPLQRLFRSASVAARNMHRNARTLEGLDIAPMEAAVDLAEKFLRDPEFRLHMTVAWSPTVLTAALEAVALDKAPDWGAVTPEELMHESALVITNLTTMARIAQRG